MQRNKFEDSSQEAVIPIQQPAEAVPARIFDNQVEHASRENTERSGLIILTILVPCSLSSTARTVPLLTSVNRW